MTHNTLTLTNSQARATFLRHHLLDGSPSGPGSGKDLQAVLDDLGFVQVDSINTVARAHDLIMWSRRQQFRPPALRNLVDRDRTSFEGWTHDASILPMAFLPYWQHKFRLDDIRLQGRWKNWHRGDFIAATTDVLHHIRDNGPTGSSDVGKSEKRGSGGWWDWHPSKTALEYLWRTGQIMVSRREGFRKLYDLTERVAPADAAGSPSWDETRDWACTGALQRLGFATHSEIAAFWDLVPVAEAKTWVEQGLKSGRLTPINIRTANGDTHASVALIDRLTSLQSDIPKSNRVRILSPFDPALRDRARALRLFGFDYRIEIFVPEAKRKYAYYVFPVLEGQKLIGRIDIKADRKRDVLDIRKLWLEPKARLTEGRNNRLAAEIERIRRLAGASQCDWSQFQAVLAD